MPILALAVFGGLLWSLCFGVTPRPALGFVALVPFVLLTRHRPRRAALFGWLHGTAFWLASVVWIAPTVSRFSGMPPGPATDAMGVVAVLLASLYLGLYDALAAWLAAHVWSRPDRASATAAPPPPRAQDQLRLIAGIAAAWTLVAWMREFVLGGFPWNLAAYAWTDLPGALPLAAWLGAQGVGAVLVMGNVALALFVVGARGGRFTAGFAIGTALLLLALAGRFSHAPEARPFDGGVQRAAEGVPTWANPAGDPRSAPRIHAPVTLVQPNIPVRQAVDEAARADYQRLLTMSHRACDGQPRLLLWPESAAWPQDYARSARLRDDLARLAARGCTVLINTPMRRDADDAFTNSTLLIDDSGIIGRYDKRRLVPFGEFVPLGDRLPFLRQLARSVGSGFVPGAGLGLMRWTSRGPVAAEHVIGTALCYEVVFPRAVAAQVRGGASVLVTLTNDAWYGNSSAPHQHLRAARFRAAETRRPLLRAAITGISATVDARGQLVDQLGVGETGTISAQLQQPAAHLSPYVRAPWLVPAASMVALAAAIAFANIRRRSHSSATRHPTIDQETS